MVESDFVAILTPTLASIVAMTVLGGTIVKGVTWLNKKQDEKATVLKKQTEEYADNLKKQSENVAANLKTNNEMIALALAKVATDTAMTLKENNERIASGLKENNERIAISLKDNNAATSLLLTATLKESTDKLNLLLANLRERADLTNGNVAAIRTDLRDLQADMEAREEVEREDYDDTPKEKKSRQRLQISRNRADVNKRRKIEEDRISQDRRRR